MKKLTLATVALLASHNLYSASLNDFDLGFYGFIKSSVMYSSEALASYNNINLSAPTHAPAQTRSQDKTSRMSFQTQQSRAGINLKKGDQLSAKLEFDLIDFNKSSPTTQMVPRVRIASVTYGWENNKVIIGQDWDLFSPVTSYTYDYVGLFFLAGNSGFMRQQVQYLRTEGNWEFGGALGMAGNNPGVTDNDLELTKSPSYSLRVTRKLTNGRIGLSGIYANLQYDQTTTIPKSSHDAYAGNIFYEQTFGKVSLKSEGYYGQNLANLGSLTIGKGTNTTDVREFGATLTGTYIFTETQSLFGGVGMARVDNPSEITPFALGTGSQSNVITSPGIRQNFLSRVGYEYKITPDFSWISEFSRYETDSKIADNSYQLNVVYGLESGIQLRF